MKNSRVGESLIEGKRFGDKRKLMSIKVVDVVSICFDSRSLTWLV